MKIILTCEDVKKIIAEYIGKKVTQYVISHDEITFILLNKLPFKYDGEFDVEIRVPD